MKKEVVKKIAKKALGTIAIPLGVLIILLVICGIKGVNMFPNSTTATLFLRSIATVMLTTIALSINLNSGRFDFSLGAVMTISTYLSVSLCIKTGANAIVMLLLCAVFGAVFGALSGGLYVLLKLPPIITSLGVTLLYEGLTFALSGGSSLSFGLNTALTSFARSNFNIILIIAVVLIAMVVVFDYTKYGKNYNALMCGQKVAVNTGIKEVPNTIACYLIAGLLMGIVGALTASNQGSVTTGSLNFGSIGIMFTAFLPMFIGGFIGRFSNNKLGYLLGALTTSLITISYTALNLSSPIQSIITAVLLVVFLIYLNNENKIIELVTLKKLIQKLKNKKRGVVANESK